MSSAIEKILREECPDMPERQMQLILAICSDMDADERRERQAVRREIARQKKQEAVQEAQKLLRLEKRPVRRNDMLSAMDLAIAERIRMWEEEQSKVNAVMLLATVICKNILLDGPLHEE